ncbi:MAG TPA: 2,3-bisphosphoglycerate-independent phosphoglycerate mutase [bacterium]|nr:2,3-bisphosphoglycerate-independent phosphoglycerate mutase [bacterium]HPP29428.1 2,3-bisphosphoglycerate-independent phosphoglycerate mutase [bacterium]
MNYDKILPGIIKKTDSKILLVVMDGVGGLPHPETGKTELETAKTPFLDELASKSSCGLTIPVLNGITPGSGPGHIALFGYDPIDTQIGRGVLECLGIGAPVEKDDVAIRGNFATINPERIVTDRRAGRIATEENKKIVSIISEKIKEIKGVKVSIYTVKEHRCAIVLKGSGLVPSVSENDPQKEGQPLKPIKALDRASEKTAEVLREFEEKVIEILSGIATPAKALLFRGISKLPDIKGFADKYKLNAVCIATYPMYKGVSKVVGMDVIDGLETIESEINALQEIYNQYDFFFIHIKKTDSYGEDGNFDAKVKIIEEADRYLSSIKNIKFGAIAITGDHSTPALLKSHSWHTLPILINSPYAIPDDAKRLTERECAKGILGRIYSKEIMYLLLAHSLKLDKFGA